MIKYMVIVVRKDTSVDVLAFDLHDIEKANDTRSWWMNIYPTLSADNIQIIQYRG